MNKVFIYELANVSTDVKIGVGTQIWINAQVRENSIIRNNCVISKDTYIDRHIKIGIGGRMDTLQCAVVNVKLR